jgi:hypothetical protein
MNHMIISHNLIMISSYDSFCVNSLIIFTLDIILKSYDAIP